MDCCCQCILFSQPDFANQCSQLQELIERHNHLCNFYPKYHCKLNLIEGGQKQSMGTLLLIHSSQDCIGLGQPPWSLASCLWVSIHQVVLALCCTNGLLC
ncbi:hypothetical protein EI94DRAFT_1566825 [Lactarius quietus]|nr:hypothetical protein EI94DRAFT_1566825 [Lactarius quietus]